MPSPQAFITALSSICLRLACFIFFRWVPGHPFPPLIGSLAAVYFIGFWISWFSSTPFEVVDEQITVVARPVANGDPDVRRVKRKADGKLVAANEVIQELDVSEAVTLEEKGPHVLSTLLTGLPSPTSILWSLATFGINVVLVILMCDLTWRAALFYPAHELSMARVGYVSDTTARLLIREPDADALPIHLSYRYADKHLPTKFVHQTYDTAWKFVGSETWLTNDTDFTARFTISGLTPDTRYQYAFSNNHTGFFITAPPTGQFSKREGSDGKFTFFQTSCILPHFPYNPFDHPLTVPGFKLLSPWLSRIKPAFMLFLGDFVYADVPHRHGKDTEAYRRLYRQVYASPDWPSVSTTLGGASSLSSASDATHHSIPWLHTYDDHEIGNDWNSNTTPPYPAAFDPYTHYHLSVNPPPSPSHPSAGPPYTHFTHGPATFFILDTRRYRTPPSPSDPWDPTASILGPAQLSSLLRWLAAPAAPGVRWKILATSVPLTKNWRVNAADTWAGYLAERQRILDAMWAFLAAHNGTAGVVVLSGDRHEFAATAFPPPPGHWTAGKLGQGWGGKVPVEFSASPLNQFYVPVRTYRQTDGEDVCVKYLPEGNSKFGVVEVAGTGSGQSVLTYRLVVDGKEAWSHVLTVDGAAEEESEWIWS